MKNIPKTGSDRKSCLFFPVNCMVVLLVLFGGVCGIKASIVEGRAGVITTDDAAASNPKNIRSHVRMLAGVSRVAELEYSDDDVFTIVDEMPEFPGGGQAALLQYLAASIRYPHNARENGIQGRVVCNFIINKDGKVQDAEVIRSVSPDLDREALRVINAMPPWTPGKQKGKAVRVRYCIPIVFRLQ